MYSPMSISDVAMVCILGVHKTIVYVVCYIARLENSETQLKGLQLLQDSLESDGNCVARVHNNIGL